MSKSAPPESVPDLLAQADADLLARYEALVRADGETLQQRQQLNDVHGVRLAGRLPVAPHTEECDREQE